MLQAILESGDTEMFDKVEQFVTFKEQRSEES